MRVLRVDKLSYAALEATLEAYERGAAEAEIPVIRAIATSAEEIAERAEALVGRVRKTCSEIDAELIEGESVIGGGSAPEVKLKTVLVSLTHAKLSARDLEAHLRRHVVPVIARTERDHVLIDLRTVMREDEDTLLDAITAADAPGNL
jgi:L-seryl-tRNA(Ser) seleniumtransferase